MHRVRSRRSLLGRRDGPRFSAPFRKSHEVHVIKLHLLCSQNSCCTKNLLFIVHPLMLVRCSLATSRAAVANHQGTAESPAKSLEATTIQKDAHQVVQHVAKSTTTKELEHHAQSKVSPLLRGTVQVRGRV